MQLPVFYNENMIVDVVYETPSPRKPREVVREWQAKYPIRLVDFAPLCPGDFYLAHTKEHVDGIISLERANGMDNRDPEVVESLYWTSGSLWAAACHALENRVAVSPTSGFHHAGHDFCWGFCTFNGLLVSAMKLLHEKGIRTVGILDFDQHQGDGSEDIIDKLGLSDRIIHITGKTSYTRERKAFFEQLPGLLESLRPAEIILYQAGADQHEHDPLGGFLNNDELRTRDRLVFEYAYRHAVPIAWNLAGGYQEERMGESRSIQKVLDIHNATLEECLRVFA